MPRTGRRPKLNADLQAEICKRLEAGAFMEVAAADVGLHRTTVLGWLAKGRAELDRRARGEQPNFAARVYVDFLDAVTRASAKAEVGILVSVRAAARGGALLERRTITHSDGRSETVERYSAPDWRAGAFVLERRFQSRWRNVAKVQAELEVSGPGGEPIRVESARQFIEGRLAEIESRLELPSGTVEDAEIEEEATP